MRTYKASKTRQGKPKITLYENGQVMLCRPVRTVKQGGALGRAWADSDELIYGKEVS
jgi:hypothetical protein